MRARDWLDRFRPAGSPGAARPAGVPADEAATRTAELAPVFAALADTQRECESIRKAAHAEADDRREHAALRAAAILTSGEAAAAAQRAEARSGRLRHYEQEAVSIVAAAEQEARQVAERADRRLPELLDQVRGTLLQAVAAVAGVDPSDTASPDSVTPRNGFPGRSGKEP